MKINRILLNCRRDTALGGEMGADPVLLFFRTPVSYMDGGVQKKTAKSSVALLTSGYKQSFRSVRSPCTAESISASSWSSPCVSYSSP